MSNNTFAPAPWDPNWHPSLQASIDYQASNYVGIAAIVLLLYDTILTIPDATKYMYSRKFTVISWLYIIAQYGTLCQLVFNWAVFTNTLTHYVPRVKCNGLNLAYYLTFIGSAIGIQGMLYSRAYAVAPKNRVVNGLLGSLFLVNLGVALSLLRWWKCDTSQGDDYTTIGCSQTGAIGQISIVLFDIGVLITILYHTWSLVGSQKGYSTSFSALFIRQGIFRFAIISAWSLGDALSYKLARPSAAGSDTTLEIALSPILLGRFLFQLRKAAEKTNSLAHIDESTESHQVTSFRAAVDFNHGNTTTIFTNLSAASGDSDTLPNQ